MKTVLASVIILVLAAGGWIYSNQRQTPGISKKPSVASIKKPAKTTSTNQDVKAVAVPSVCASNTDVQKIVVDISDQHAWMCEGAKEVYDASVTTGAYTFPDNATPTGTWKILAKYTNLYLKGSDSRGSWNDHVSHWMPFYADYGFHDATWQTLPFGSKDYPTKGSHGCVRLSLETATWLHNWANVGATVTIQS